MPMAKSHDYVTAAEQCLPTSRVTRGCSQSLNSFLISPPIALLYDLSLRRPLLPASDSAAFFPAIFATSKCS